MEPLVSGHAAQLVHSFAPGAQQAAGVTVNDTHATFYAGHMIQAGFARATHSGGLNTTASGVNKMVLQITPLSTFPNTVAAFGEKLLVHLVEGFQLLQRLF